MIPYGRQDISQADIDAVIETLQSDFLTQGPAVERFETALTDYCGAAFGVAVNSATSALHIACLALELGPGDLLWTSPITFVASANCALYCGADVDFVDIDPATFNMCPCALETKLEAAQAAGRLPKVIVPVHMTGQSCDMAAIAALARKYGVRVIEDASHAIGGRYLGAPIGNCAHSDITVFSFHPVKIVTTAEGGAAMTNDVRLAERLRLFRSHGITRDPRLMTHAPDGPWYYQQVELGYNYRITDLQAALGVSQMTRVDDYVARRHAIADRYDALLAGLPVLTPLRHLDGRSALHLYVIRLAPEALERPGHRAVFEGLRARGVGVNLHYIPVHTQPYYSKFGFAPGDFPASEAYYASAISLPMFPTLSEDDQRRVVDALKDTLAA
ncbi:UDP-4-amino-4,6-dideoxy-N-acetyl-beta-L-altrosamine transaminase [Shinella sp.]|uniref:UDP-4-amino-4, 6-dideoxy-N-acetyl-beta-L-altrosamine transaminase n=1 Tax=Shinella sp. TaxID=1870904 RepID=UPI0039E6E2A8